MFHNSVAHAGDDNIFSRARRSAIDPGAILRRPNHLPFKRTCDRAAYITGQFCRDRRNRNKRRRRIDLSFWQGNVHREPGERAQSLLSDSHELKIQTRDIGAY